jgi:hypothetical protein
MILPEVGVNARDQLEAGCREFYGQRHPVEAGADLGHLWPGLYDLLEVIHKQQQFSLFQILSQTLGVRLLSKFPEP